MNRAQAIYRLIHDQPDERRQAIAYLRGRTGIFATTTLPDVASMMTKLTSAERAELLTLLGDDDDDGRAGVRETRSPRPPRGGAAGAVAEIDYEPASAVAVAEPREVPASE
jgi:hypothetical protein